MDFLTYVIDDPDSLHNALLQTYYMVQVASGLRSKTNFFLPSLELEQEKACVISLYLVCLIKLM